MIIISAWSEIGDFYKNIFNFDVFSTRHKLVFEYNYSIETVFRIDSNSKIKSRFLLDGE